MKTFVPRLLVQVLIVGLALLAGRGAAAQETAPFDFEDRVECLRAIEEVRWRFRSWPESNPGTKPPFASVLTPGVLEARVEDALLKTSALAEVWNRPLTALQLQAELEQMASRSRAPEMLRQIWAALGDDPQRLAECLARPLLADRLARSWYARDARFHDPLRERALQELELYGQSRWMRLLSGEYSESVWILDSAAGEQPPGGPGEMLLDERRWTDAVSGLGHALGSRHAIGSEDDLPLGALSSLQEDESRFYVVALLERQPGRLRVAEVAWRKVSFQDWWSETRRTLATGLAATAGDFRLPEIAGECADDSWNPMRHLPNGRALHVAVWTGSEMLVWGNRDVFGSTEPGGLYDPATDTWHPMTTAGQPEGNMVTAAVWTGTEMLVWGGFHGDGTVTPVNTGAGYDPLTDTWRPTAVVGAPSPRGLHTAVWTGDEMIVWGGCGDTSDCGAYLDTGGRYDPATDSWQPTSAVGAPSPRQFHTGTWTGSEMVIWAGEGQGLFNTLNDGARYDPLSDGWTPMTQVDAPDARIFHTAVSTGDDILVFGGCRADGCTEFITGGGRYDLAADTWSAMSTSDEPSARYRQIAIWTGAEMIVQGGCTHNQCSFQTTSGGRYDPVSDSWSPISEIGAPYRASHTAVWTGAEMILWGGCSTGECQSEHASGARYDPATDSWVSTSVETSPVARINHSAVWTGAEMILWGGAGASNDGSRYDPATDSWTPLNPLGGRGRDRPTAVWTGTEMLVWGGSQAGVGASNTGERYDVISDSWTAMSTAGAPQARLNQSGVWTGTEMIVWGGCAGCIAPYFKTGGRYSPATDTWTPTSTVGAPAGRIATSSATQPLAVWTGSEMIVWGGWPTGAGETNTGGRYSPATDTWTPTPLAGAPAPRRHHTLVWTDDEMIVWGGEDSLGTVFDDGARFSPATGGWTPLSASQAPSPRFRHGSVWTGEEMIVWAGTDGVGDTDTGGRYDPVSDSWSPTSTGAFSPFPRHLHTTVWTGSQMLVWGGAWNQTGQTGTGAGYCAQRAGVGCDDLLLLRARCTASGRLQARVTLVDTSHDGESIVFDVDGQLIPRPIVNGRASLNIPNQGGTGMRTIGVDEPAGCFAPSTVTCN